MSIVKETNIITPLAQLLLTWLFIFYACLVRPVCCFCLDIQKCKALEVLNYQEKTSCEMMQGHKKKETAWFMVQENSAAATTVLCSIEGSVRVPSEQSQWPTAAVVIKHEPEAWSSAQMFGFWCWNSKNFVPSSKVATHDKWHPCYLYYSPSRQLSMCWPSIHTRWEWMALLFTLTMTWKIGDMLSKGIHPEWFRLQLAFCSMAKEQLNYT